MQDKKCLIVGAGKVAFRRARTMLEFGAEVKVIAPEVNNEFYSLDGVLIDKREITEVDIENHDIVIAATSDQAVNKHIAHICKEKNIPVNVVDNPDEGTFIFPAYEKTGNIVAAFSTGGNNPAVARYLKNAVNPYMTEELAECAEFLGMIRPIVKEQITDQKERKRIYNKLFEIYLMEERIPEKEDLIHIINELKEEKSR